MADIQQVKTSSGSVTSGRGILTGIVASLAGTASQGTLTVYDNTAGSGTVIFQAEIFSDSQPLVIFFADRFAPRFTTGLYVTLESGLVVNIWATDR